MFRLLSCIWILALLQMQSDFASAGKFELKMCRRICQRFVVFVKMDPNFMIPTNKFQIAFVKKKLEAFCKQSIATNHPMCATLHRSIKDIAYNLFKEKKVKTVCNKAKVCQMYMKKQSGKTKTRTDSCKICRFVANTLAGVLDVIGSIGQLVDKRIDKACSMFFEDLEERKECIKISDKIELIEELILNGTKRTRICAVAGFCNVSGQHFVCGDDMKMLSPWQSAISILRGFTRKITSDSTNTEELQKNIQRTALFTGLNQCLKKLKGRWNTQVQSRKRRSIGGKRCQICTTMSNKTISDLKQQIPLISNPRSICSSLVSQENKQRCQLVFTFATSVQSMLMDITAPEICNRIDCPSPDTMISPTDRSKTCQVCKALSKIIAKDVKYVSVTSDFLVQELAQLCANQSSENTEKCNVMMKSMASISDHLKKHYVDGRICTNLGVC